MGNKKTLGVILIIIGIAFIALGVWAGTLKTTTKPPVIYNEQNETNVEEKNANGSIYLDNVNVYTEENEQEATRYIY